jgi:hypothetical protein
MVQAESSYKYFRSTCKFALCDSARSLNLWTLETVRLELQAFSAELWAGLSRHRESAGLAWVVIEYTHTHTHTHVHSRVQEVFMIRWGRRGGGRIFPRRCSNYHGLRLSDYNAKFLSSKRTRYCLNYCFSNRVPRNLRVPQNNVRASERISRINT